MPTSFLDLPRELRDEIYAYALISSSGVVSPHWIPPRTSKFLVPKTPPPSTTTTTVSSQLIGRFRLYTNPPKLCPIRGFESETWREKHPYISLSLPRTCRQIYEETESIFWELNTFYFSSANAGVIRTMKMMGQVSSRLITSVIIQMDCGSDSTRLISKTLNVLASRARYGHFRRLELLWDEDQFKCLMDLAKQIPMARARQYDELLEGLRTGESGGRFERVVRLPEMVGQRGREAEACARDLHFAFGGTLFWGDMLGWENWKEVFPVEASLERRI
jgi:hypothetical protein